MKNTVYTAKVVFFSENSGYAKIIGGPLDEQTVLITDDRCRITIPGFITRTPLDDMPAEGKEIVLILKRQEDQEQEMMAYIWGPAKGYGAQKRINPAPPVPLKIKVDPALDDEPKPQRRHQRRKDHNDIEIDLREIVHLRDLRSSTVTDYYRNNPSRRLINPNQRPRVRHAVCGIAHHVEL